MAAETKKRILDAAISLFARKGYGSTGMRELASEAGVSLAMINYHYGSKQALLEEILQGFFLTLREAAERNLSGDGSVETKLRRHLRWMVEYYRQHPEMVRVAFTEFPHDVPGLVDLKADQVRSVLELVSRWIIPGLPEAVRRNLRLEIFGPALMGAVVFHFLMRPVVEASFEVTFDEAFYEGFADQLSDFVLHGIYGLGESRLTSEGGGDA